MQPKYVYSKLQREKRNEENKNKNKKEEEIADSCQLLYVTVCILSLFS